MNELGCFFRYFSDFHELGLSIDDGQELTGVMTADDEVALIVAGAFSVLDDRGPIFCS